MYECGWFTCQVHLGPCLGCTGLPLREFKCLRHIHAFKCSTKAKKIWRQCRASRPHWSADQGVAPLYKSQCIGFILSAPNRAALECPRVLYPLCSICFCSCSKFIRKKNRNIFPPFSIPLALRVSFRLCYKNVFVVVLLLRKNDFVVCSGPQEWFCVFLITHKDDFVRGDQVPQGLLTLGWLTLIFTNFHVTIPSFVVCSCVRDFRYKEDREEAHGCT